MPVLTDDDVGLVPPARDKLLSDADVGLGDSLESPYQGLSPEERRRKIYGDYLRNRKEDIELGGSPSAGAMLPEAMHEQGAAARTVIRPWLEGPAQGKPGGVLEGVRESAASALAAPFDPSVGVPMALTAVAPEVMLPYWTYQGIKDAPEAIAQTITGETPSEKVQGGARTAMDILMMRGGVEGVKGAGALLRESLSRPQAAPLPRPPLAEPALISPEGYRVLGGGRFGSDQPPPIEAENVSSFKVGGKTTYTFRLPAKEAAPSERIIPSEVFKAAEPTPPASAAEKAQLQKDLDEELGQSEVQPAVDETASPLAPAPTETTGPVRAPESEVRKTDSGTFLTLPQTEFTPEKIAAMTPDNRKALMNAVNSRLGTKLTNPSHATLAQKIGQVFEKMRNDLTKGGDLNESKEEKGQEEVAPTAAKLSSDVGARKSTPEGTARVEEAQQKLRDAINNPDLVDKQRADTISNLRELVGFLKANADTRKSLETDYFKGDKIAFTGVDLPDGREFIYLEGHKAGDYGVRAEPTTGGPPPAAQAQVTKVAATEGVRSAKAIKEDLITEIQDRLQKAPADLNDVPKEQRTVTIEIPGDGKFTVSNTIEAISELLDRAKKIKTDVKAPGVPKAAIRNNTKMFEEQRAEAEEAKKPSEPTADLVEGKPKTEEPAPSTEPKKWIVVATSSHRQVQRLHQAAKVEGGGLPVAMDSKTRTWHLEDTPENRAVASRYNLPIRAKETQLLNERRAPATAGPSPQALGIAPGQAAVKAIGEKLSSIRSKLANSWSTRGNKADIARLKDAADNQARILAAQQGKSVLLEARRTFSGQARQALRAVIPMIESGGDRTRLPQFIAQSRTHFEARKAAEFAEANWDRLQPLAAKIKAIHDAQIAQENAHGIATEYRENYIKHAFDVEKLPNRGQEFFGSGGAGARSGFKAARKFETVYDAIEAGYGKALKSLDADKLTQSRLASGQQLINDRQWVNGFRGINDPTTGKPLLDDVTFDRNHFPIAPPGYDAVQVLPGQFIAVHNGYGKIFKAVTGESKIAQGEIAGLPVGELILNTAAGIKHGLLLFDTFHASRIMQKQFFLTGKVGWNKGLSLLDYTDADLNEAVRQGEITSDMANYARANRGTAQLLLREGLNVGRIQEALRNEVVRNLPVVGAFNRLVFDKITRGAMMESALIEFERVRANNPGMTPQTAAAMTAKKINVTFGNIGRQGLFKSRTMQDLSRLLALAPQWVESMARSEVGGFKELGQVPVDLALGKGLQVGTLGKTMAGGLLAYVVGTQLLNLATRGQFTWQNKEEGHKLDAWIPDVTGKTPGFFLNPLSVVAELTHDAYRYAFKSDSAIDIAGEILNNKMSPLARSQKIFWSGKNYSGEKIDGTWKRIKESAAALTPAPIPVSGFNSGRPGQAQRQLTASAGIKTEPAPTATKQIADKAARFVADKGKPKEVDLVYHEGSPHNALRNAIARGDEEAAMQAIATLRKTQTDAKIYQAWRQTLTHPFTGSAAMEAKFRQSLSEDDKQLYDAAKKERQARFTAFQALWAKRK